jgi:hypothetical protein
MSRTLHHRKRAGIVAGLVAAAVVATSTAATSSAPTDAESAGWLPQKLLAATGAPPDATYPYRDHLAVVAPDGLATAVWRNDNGVLRMAHRRPGGEWGRATVVATGVEDLGDAVVDGAGRVTVIWTKKVASDDRLRSVVRSWRPGDGLGPSKVLGRGGRPALATNRQGDLLALWAAGGAWSSYRPAGGQWRASRALPSSSMDVSGILTIAMDGTGRTYTVAPGIADSGVVRMTAYLPGSDRWRRSWQIAHVGQLHDTASVAANEAGDLVVGWTRTSMDGDGSFHTGADAMYRPAGGSFGPVHQLFKGASGDYREARVAVGIGADGRGHVAWIGDIPTGATGGPLYTSHRMPGGGWVTKRLLTDDVLDSSIAMSVNRNGVVLVSAVHADEDQRLVAFRYPAGGPYGPERVLSSFPTKLGATTDLGANGIGVALYSPVGDVPLYARSFGR